MLFCIPTFQVLFEDNKIKVMDNLQNSVARNTYTHRGLTISSGPVGIPPPPPPPLSRPVVVKYNNNTLIDSTSSVITPVLAPSVVSPASMGAKSTPVYLTTGSQGGAFKIVSLGQVQR